MTSYGSDPIQTPSPSSSAPLPAAHLDLPPTVSPPSSDLVSLCGHLGKSRRALIPNELWSRPVLVPPFTRQWCSSLMVSALGSLRSSQSRGLYRTWHVGTPNFSRRVGGHAAPCTAGIPVSAKGSVQHPDQKGPDLSWGIYCTIPQPVRKKSLWDLQVKPAGGFLQESQGQGVCAITFPVLF